MKRDDALQLLSGHYSNCYMKKWKYFLANRVMVSHMPIFTLRNPYGYYAFWFFLSRNEQANKDIQVFDAWRQWHITMFFSPRISISLLLYLLVNAKIQYYRNTTIPKFKLSWESIFWRSKIRLSLRFPKYVKFHISCVKC